MDRLYPLRTNLALPRPLVVEQAVSTAAEGAVAVSESCLQKEAEAEEAEPQPQP